MSNHTDENYQQKQLKYGGLWQNADVNNSNNISGEFPVYIN